MISVGQRRRTAAVVGLACAAALGFALFDGTAAAASPPVGSIRNAGLGREPVTQCDEPPVEIDAEPARAQALRSGDHHAAIA